MTVLQPERRRMHRHSDELVAAVVSAAVAELRRQVAGVGEWEAEPGFVEVVRALRSGVTLRAQYEMSRAEGEPPYDELSAGTRDEDQLTWLITQALTDNAN